MLKQLLQNETHKVENTTEAISAVEEKVNVATNTDKSSDKKLLPKYLK